MKVATPNPLRGTLGFFFQGIPVVFIKNDVLFRRADSEDHYFKLIGEDGEGKTGIVFGDDAALAFNRFATLLHELRHFHDALLCRPLFEQFLRQHKITLAVMQILSRLTKHRYLPAGVNDPIWHSDPEMAFLKQLIDDIDEDAFNRSQGLYADGMIESDSISLEHLLEASAITTELLHLHAIHGVESMEHYYRTVILNAGKLYKGLVERFVTLYSGNILYGIDALYCALGISLYSSDNPIARFVLIYEELRRDTGTLRVEVERWLSNPVPDEDDLAQRVYGEWLIDYASRQPIGPESFAGHEFPMEEFACLHQTLYEARRTLIRRYIRLAGYRSDFYVDHLHEFASPAVLFYPVEADSSATVVPAILKSDLQADGIEHYPIADAEEERIVLAGLRNFPSTRSCISFEVTDHILFVNFCYRYLFMETERSYSRGVDDTYLHTLRSLVLARCEGEI
ncbi:hypothetical protein AB4Y89_16480 [Terriglobus sp. 2YAB30_2]|uniref:hypothetical protein n=1 Tax=Terriglobus sp. 2YAB30_2 TaxID=3233023 RepID=UPI003F9CB9DE